MATVFLAVDERLGRRVAVKRLHAGSPEEHARRFAREAKLGAALNHPNLVTVFDAVAEEEGVLIVMEFVDGPTLADELRAGRLPPERAAQVVRGVAAGLDHAHAGGVVHRDVKPANVLLGAGEAVKLADLGIATAAEHTRITSSDMVLGTASYMAPEQLEGRSAGPAADVYALAAVAFEALSGRKARAGSHPVEIAHAIAAGPPPDLREAWPEAPAAAGAALRRGMARDPQARPATAGELARELSAALEDEPTAATRPLPVDPPAKPARDPRAAWAGGPTPTAIALGLVGLVLLVAGIAALGSDGDEDAKPAPREPAAEPKQRDSAAPPAKPRPSPTGVAEGARLNAQGFGLMRQGRYADAVPVLRRAVAAFPSGTDDVNYAYALYNLGRALRLSGRPAEAIPILEQRLQIPNQTEAVRRELEAARAAAYGEEPAPPAKEKGKGKGKKGKDD